MPAPEQPTRDDLNLNWRVVVASLAFAAAVLALIAWVVTRPIISAPDEPAQSPAATAGQIPPGGAVELTAVPLRPGGVRITRTLLVSTRAERSR